MGVPALELKPRGTVALFDAALRLCARSTGVWSLTLPAGACVLGALFHLVDVSTHRGPLLEPVALFTAAWVFRALCMGAACHFLEGQVLGAQEPDAWLSFRAALKRAPSLIITAAFTAFLNALLWSFTFGLGFLFVGAHNVAYAVAMRGQGHPLLVYGTATRLLGPARHTAAWVRLCGLSQALVLLNLHLVTGATLYLGKQLLALDLTFLERFTSLDNATWVAALVAATFTLFEPLRAATATLLLIDGRVRQEGLDLLATLEQLPRRRKPRAPVAAAVALALLVAGVARAQDDWSGVYTPGHTEQPAQTAQHLKERLGGVIAECGLAQQISPDLLDAAGRLPGSDQSSLSRFVARVERRAFDDDDCEGAAADLKRGLELIAQAQQLAAAQQGSARDEAKQILARPEFALVPPADPKAQSPEQDEAPGWFARWWKSFWEAIWRWLRGLRANPGPQANLEGPGLLGGGMGFANVVAVVAIIGVIAFLGWLLWRNRDRLKTADADADVTALSESALSTDPMSALSRPPEGWAGLADQLAQQGQYREAIRHLYLALLSRLHRDGAIDYDPARSNWDYFRAFKGPAAALAPFRELTRRFDFAWYGQLEVSQASWRTFRGLCEPLLATDSEGLAASA